MSQVSCPKLGCLGTAIVLGAFYKGPVWVTCSKCGCEFDATTGRIRDE